MRNALTGFLLMGYICLAIISLIEWKRIQAKDAIIIGLESQVRDLASETRMLSSRLEFQVKGEQARDPQRDELFDELQKRLNEADRRWRVVQGYRARLLKCVLERSPFEVDNCFLK